MVQKQPKRTQRRETELAPVVLDERAQELKCALGIMLPQEYGGQLDAEVDMIVLTLPASSLREVSRLLKETSELRFDYLCSITVVDYEEIENRFEVIYHMVSFLNHYKLAVKISVSTECLVVPSVNDIWRSAGWFEREGHDLYGVVFDGNPDLSPLLLYEGFDGYPGRRSFPYHDYQEW